MATKFKSITIEGFGSIITPLTIKLSSPGFRMIKGGNGVGKTTFLSALYWATFGKSIKPNASISTWEHLRDNSFKGTKVVLVISKNRRLYTITRLLDYKEEGVSRKVSSLSISGLHDDELQGIRDKRDYQAFIENTLLGMTPKLFLGSIVFGQKLKRLIEESNSDKKEFFEEIFNLAPLNEAHKLALGKYEQYTLEVKTITQDLVKAEELKMSKESEYKSLRASLEALRQVAKEKTNATQEIKELERKSKKLAQKLEGLDTTERTLRYDLGTAEKTLASYESLVEVMEIRRAKIESLIERVDKLKAPKDKCPRCNQPLSKDNRLKLAQEEAGLRKTIDDLIFAERNDKHILASFGDMEVLNEEIREARVELKEWQKKIRKVEDEKLETEALLKSQRNKPKGVNTSSIRRKLSEKLTKIKGELQKVSIAQANLSKTLGESNEKLGDYEWLIKEPLSSRGLKAFIINGMLERVNEKLQEYSRYLHFRVEIAIDLESYHKNYQVVVYRGKNITDYKDLSGGQQQLVNVAMALASHDIINDLPNKKTNLLIMDEVFESLDEVNIELVSELLKLKAETKAVFLITHNRPFNVSNSKVISLSLDRGATIMN